MDTLKPPERQKKTVKRDKDMARRRLSSVQPSQDQGINSLQEALEQIDVHALKFVFLTRSWTLKLLWLLMFLGGLAFAVYYIREIVLKYTLRQTVTKTTTKNDPNGYDYPPMYLCPRHNWDLQKSDQAGLSRDALTHAAWLIKKNDSKPFLPPFESDVLKAEHELHKFIGSRKDIKKNTYADFYKWMAHDFETMVLKYSGIESVNFETVFIATQVHISKPLDYGACYNITAGKYNPHTSQSLYIQYDVDEAGIPYGFDKDFLVIRDDHRLILEKDRIYLRANRITTVRIGVKEYTKTEKNGCKEPPENEPYSQRYCRFDCLAQVVKKCSECTLLQEETELIGHNLLCTWAKNENLSVCAEKDYYHQRYNKCLPMCLPLCAYKSYDVSVSMVVLNPDNYTDTRVSLSIDFAVDDGILSFEEIPLFDIESMISNVGGLLGLWTGASLLTIVEIVYLMAQFCCANWKFRKQERRRRREESVRRSDDNRSPSLTPDQNEYEKTPVTDEEHDEPPKVNVELVDDGQQQENEKKEPCDSLLPPESEK